MTDLDDGPEEQWKRPRLLIVGLDIVSFWILKPLGESGDETFTYVTRTWNDCSGEHEREGVLLIKGP